MRRRCARAVSIAAVAPLKDASVSPPAPSASATAIFIHGGPGIDAAVERKWFGTELPVLWWDQPPIPEAHPAPLSALSNAAGEQVRRLVDLNGGPIDLIAHSFGGRIAIELSRVMPEQIKRIVLLACGMNPIAQILRLGQQLVNRGEANHALAAAVAAMRTRFDEERFFALLAAINAIPDVLRTYFARASQTAAQRYFELAATVATNDAATFAAAMREQLRLRQPIGQSIFVGPVALYFGREDPLIAAEEDLAKWSAVFPQASCQVVAGGHMLHLEIPPDEWLPREGR